MLINQPTDILRLVFSYNDVYDIFNIEKASKRFNGVKKLTALEKLQVEYLKSKKQFDQDQINVIKSENIFEHNKNNYYKTLKQHIIETKNYNQINELIQLNDDFKIINYSLISNNETSRGHLKYDYSVGEKETRLFTFCFNNDEVSLGEQSRIKYKICGLLKEITGLRITLIDEDDGNICYYVKNKKNT